MTQLVAALHTLGLDGEIALSGHWVKLHGERCSVYVAEPTRGSRYFTWCDGAGARDVEAYGDPVEAIQAGLRRAARRDPELTTGGTTD